MTLNLEENDLTTFILDSNFNKTLNYLNLNYNNITNFSGYSFAALQTLSLNGNNLGTFNGNNLTTLKTLYLNDNPNLISLDLRSSYIDYIDQFLNEKRTHLPRLTKLAVNYHGLRMVTANFTRKSTLRNCAQVKELLFERALVYKKHFYNGIK